VGVAGGSAREEYERRRRRHDARLERRWGRLAPVAKVLSREPRATTVWRTGARGEERLAAVLGERLDGRVIVLHDRSVPGTRGNIDHLVIAPTGVWVIDAKAYSGRVERRDVGGWFRRDERLFVGGRDRSALAHGLGWQVDAVAKALGREHRDVPVHRVLCFVGADWALLGEPFVIEGVRCVWPARLATWLGEDGPLTPDRIEAIASRLSERLPSTSRRRR
jgi:hypothetical protein